MKSFSWLVAVSLLALAACEEKRTVGVGTPGDNNNNNNNDERECRVDRDCDAQYDVCDDRKCVEGPCLDGVQSAGETGVDCGGPLCGKCPIGESCLSNADCASQACANRECVDSATTANNNVNPGCLDPGDPARFVRWDNGITAEIAFVPFTRGADPVLASGIAIADFNGDGHVDVLVTNQGAEPSLFFNDGTGNFTDVTATSGLSGLTLTTSISVADFDGDGDLDVVIGRTIGGVYVMLNQGDGTFVDATDTTGIGDPSDVVSGGSFADFDGDGDLDFYLGSYLPPVEVMVPFMLPPPKPNRLYRNNGDGTFTEMAYSPGGVGEEGSTLAVAWWDFDADGRPDLWSSNDFGMFQQPSQLWRNGGPDPDDPDGWIWEDISAASGIDVAIFGMSASLADFDNDQDQDGYASNMARNVLHVVENGTSTNEALERGVACDILVDPRPAPVREPEYVARLDGMQPFLDDYTDADSPYYSLTSWAATFADFNHDGWQDLHIVNGTTLSDLTPEASFQPNYLFMNRADGTFEPAPCWALPDIRGTSRGAAAGDLDGDGDMDLIWADQGHNGDATVYVIRNEMAVGNWLMIELEGQPPNTDAIGAKVTLQAGGLIQTRWIDGGQSYMSVSERVAHFGLGAAEVIDSLVVTWPDGSTQTVPVAAVNQRLIVQQ